MFLVRNLLALAFLSLAAPAWAQTGCVPNPNANGPPFVDGCPIPASGLNAIIGGAGAANGKFFVSAGGILNRMGDRLFTGFNTKSNNGNRACTDVVTAATQNFGYSCGAATWATGPYSGTGGFTRGSDNDGIFGSFDNIGTWGICAQDSSTQSTAACQGVYAESELQLKNLSNNATAIGFAALANEADAVNYRNADVSMNPYTGLGSKPVAASFWAGCGGGYTNVFPCTAALVVLADQSPSNPGGVTPYDAGIVFTATGLPLNGDAIEMAQAQKIAWWSVTSSVPTKSVTIESTQSDNTNTTDLNFSTGGITALTSTGTAGAQFWIASSGATTPDALEFLQAGTGYYSFGINTGTHNLIMFDINGCGASCNKTAFQISAGNVTIGEAAANTVAILGALGLQTNTIASLGTTCTSGQKGLMYFVTDAAAAPVYNATVAGSGSVTIPVFCNGANWTNH